MSSESAHTPTSYTLSLIVHVIGVAMVFCVAYIASQDSPEPAKVIEVVAGAGDNWAATEAPALGNPDGDEKLKMPEISTPMPKISDPEPAAPVFTPPEPQPSEPEPVKPEPKAKPEPKQVVSNADVPSALDTKKTTMAQDFKRIAAKREKKIVDKFKKEKAAEEARAKKEAELAAKRMSKEEFDKQNAKGTGGPAGTRINAKGIAGGVVGGSTKNTIGGMGGKALSVQEQALLDQYFAGMKQRLRNSHTPPPGVGDKLVATVSFFCAADGSISNVRISRSSGNADFDESVKETFRLYRSIGSRPDHKSETLELDFKASED